MQNIRRMTKKHRTLLTVIIALLLVGVVGSFAVWDSNYSGSNSDTSEMTYADYADAYKNYIDSQDFGEIADMEYSDAVSMGELYYQLYLYSYYAAYSGEDSAKQEEYSAQSNDAMFRCVECYQQAVNVMPEDLNNDGKAEAYANLASMQLMAGNTESAPGNLETARELAPDNANVANAYAQYLCYYSGDGGYEAAVEYLNGVMENLEEGSEDYESVKSQLESIKSYQEMIEQLMASQESAESNESGETSEESTSEESSEEEK